MTPNFLAAFEADILCAKKFAFPNPSVKLFSSGKASGRALKVALDIWARTQAEMNDHADYCKIDPEHASACLRCRFVVLDYILAERGEL